MVVVLVELAVLLVLVIGLSWLLRRVREDHDELVVEHWRRNGRDRRPWGW